jgi:hypothetical protein
VYCNRYGKETNELINFPCPKHYTQRNMPVPFVRRRGSASTMLSEPFSVHHESILRVGRGGTVTHTMYALTKVVFSPIVSVSARCS